MDLLADDAARGLHERLEAVGDLALVDAHGADLDQLASLGVAAGGLGVEHHQRLARLDRLDELHDGADGGLDIGDLLGLAHHLPQLLLQFDDRLQALVREHDRVSHDRLGQDLGAGLDHHDGVLGARHDEVKLGLGHLAGEGVDHELAIDAADTDGSDGTLEGDLADGQRSRRGDGADDVGVVLLVRAEHGENALHVVLVALREERADGTVGQAASEDGCL